MNNKWIWCQTSNSIYCFVYLCSNLSPYVFQLYSEFWMFSSVCSIGCVFISNWFVLDMHSDTDIRWSNKPIVLLIPLISYILSFGCNNLPQYMLAKVQHLIEVFAFILFLVDVKYSDQRLSPLLWCPNVV